MKKLRKLKLNQISQDILTEQEMNVLKGGGTPGNCNCGCGYENHGGSSSPTNDSANRSEGYTESYGYEEDYGGDDYGDYDDYSGDGGGSTSHTSRCPTLPSCGIVDKLCGQISDPMC